MKDEGGRMKRPSAFVFLFLHPSSFILHPSAFILRFLHAQAPPLPLLLRPARRADAPAPPAAAGAQPPSEQAAQPDRSASGQALEPAVANRRLHRAQRDRTNR